MEPVPTILYVDCRPKVGMERRRLAGMLRYAAALGWGVETLEHSDCSRAALKKAIRRLRPIGCVAECWNRKTTFPPVAYGDIPVVYFGAPEKPGWQDALRVESDNAAVARLAFKELSAGKPQAYAVVSNTLDRRWAHERVDAFLACCRSAGFDCPLEVFPEADAPRSTPSPKRLVSWAASLPPHCAVFAVNDLCAHNVAKAIIAAGRHFPRTVTLVGADGTEPPPPADLTIPEMVSTVVLDHEMAGYLAAKMIGERVSRTTATTGTTATIIGDRPTCLSYPRSPSDVVAAVFPPLLVDRRKSTRGYGRREPRILEAMEMIRRKACDGLTANSLAARFSWSRHHFDLRFKEAAGHTVLDEILNVRMARATELLANSDIPVSAVAHFCGFKTELAFWKTFSKRMGVAPLHFRNARR